MEVFPFARMHAYVHIYMLVDDIKMSTGCHSGSANKKGESRVTGVIMENIFSSQLCSHVAQWNE